MEHFVCWGRARAGWYSLHSLYCSLWSSAGPVLITFTIHSHWKTHKSLEQPPHTKHQRKPWEEETGNEDGAPGAGPAALAAASH